MRFQTDRKIFKHFGSQLTKHQQRIIDMYTIELYLYISYTLIGQYDYALRYCDVFTGSDQVDA